jgi:hypothetical protein
MVDGWWGVGKAAREKVPYNKKPPLNVGEVY